VTQAPDALLLTDGVVLVDRFAAADVDALWAGEDDGYVCRSRLPGPFTRRDITNQIRTWQDQWRLGGTGQALAVRKTGSRTLVGGCALEIRPDDGEIAELSYWVFPPYRRRGYATRSVELACRYAFADLGVARIDLYIEPTNIASLRVATKAGFGRKVSLVNTIAAAVGGATWCSSPAFARLAFGRDLRA
jgi:RimJ/RimL family protein N-acetyltransferase